MMTLSVGVQMTGDSVILSTSMVVVDEDPPPPPVAGRLNWLLIDSTPSSVSYNVIVYVLLSSVESASL